MQKSRAQKRVTPSAWATALTPQAFSGEALGARSGRSPPRTCAPGRACSSPPSVSPGLRHATTMDAPRARMGCASQGTTGGRVGLELPYTQAGRARWPNSSSSSACAPPEDAQDGLLPSLATLSSSAMLSSAPRARLRLRYACARAAAGPSRAPAGRLARRRRAAGLGGRPGAGNAG